MKIFVYTMREYDELKYAKEQSERYGIEFGYCTEYPNLQNCKLAEGYDAIAINPCDMNAELIAAFYDLGVRYILGKSVGYDHIDLKKAKELGMRVSNASYPPTGVANYTIMLIMMLQRQAISIMKHAELQDFSLPGKIGKDITYQTIGVIGTGKIGKTVVKHLSGFGCRILCYARHKDPEVEKIAEYVSLDELYRQSDVITLHVNASASNYHMIGEEAFSQMKDGTMIVNASRGTLIDTKALIAALESGKIGGAALDVLEQENGLYYNNLDGKVIANHDMAILRSFPNVIVSPHMAFYTWEAVEHMIASCFEAANAFDKGIETVHEVPLEDK